jgi:AcrR family transcriptional regulator
MRGRADRLLHGILHTEGHPVPSAQVATDQRVILGQCDGEERTSLRAVAAEAEVTLVLVQHHFKTKAGLRRAVDRVVLEPSENQLQLLDGIVDFTRSEIGMLRDAGLASKKRPESHQIVAVLVRQFGELLLQPMIEAVWERAASKGEKQPRLVIRVDD